MFIENPPENEVPIWYRRAVLRDNLTDIFHRNLKRSKITPESHPKVLELFAGDGPLADELHQLGWRDITCVDRAKSPDPIAPKDTQWLYINLWSTAFGLKTGNDISKLESMRNRYNIVTATFAIDETVIMSHRDIDALCDFFLAENGFKFIV